MREYLFKFATLVFLPALAIYMLFADISNAIKIKTVDSWPKTQATIYKVTERNETTTHKSSNGEVRLKHYTNFNIYYRYKLDNKEYENSMISVGKSNFRTEHKNEMEGIRKHFAEGATLPAFYNPENHQESYLLNTSNLDSIITTLAIIGLLFFLVFFMKKTSNEDKENTQKVDDTNNSK